MIHTVAVVKDLAKTCSTNYLLHTTKVPTITFFVDYTHVVNAAPASSPCFKIWSQSNGKSEGGDKPVKGREGVVFLPNSFGLSC